MLRRVFRALLVLSSLSTAAVAQADCRPDTGVTPCIDSNSLWLATGAARFLTLPDPVVLAPGTVGLAVAAQFIARVLTVDVPSPAANGREVRFVDRIIEQELLLAAGLGRHLELGLAISLILQQSGTGSGGLTSQRAEPLESTATRDPRVSLGYGVTLTDSFALKPRLELTLPVGSRAAYASAGSPTFAPAIPVEWRFGAVTAGAELGLRLRRSVELGSVRWGSQAVGTFGLSFEPAPHELVRLSAELTVLPSLINGSSSRAESLAVETRLLPTEWLLSLRSRPKADEPWTLAVAAGAGLALSSQSSPSGSERFVAPTSPALRLLAEVRYAPEE